MATSSLHPESINQTDRQLGKGHDTSALGPSDTSDSGSDISNANLDSDTDSMGTGERASAGGDIDFSSGQDIDADRIENLSDWNDADIGEESDAYPDDYHVSHTRLKKFKGVREHR